MNEDSQESGEPTLELPDEAGKKAYVLRLYVAGTTERSRRALASIKQICDERLWGQYELEVIDVYQQPQMARAEKIVAAPALIRRRPLPARRLSGDLSNAARVLKLLGLPDQEQPNLH